MVLELGPPVRASSNVGPSEEVSGVALCSTFRLGPSVEQARGTRSAVASGAAAGRAYERERSERNNMLVRGAISVLGRVGLINAVAGRVY